MANRSFYPLSGSLTPGVVRLYGNLTIGTSGAVDASSANGFSVAKTATETGRYTITLQDSYNAFLVCNTSLVVAADAAVGASAGLVAVYRNVSVTDSSPTFDLQFTDAAGADANPASGSVIYLEIVVKNSSVTR